MAIVRPFAVIWPFDVADSHFLDVGNLLQTFMQRQKTFVREPLLAWKLEQNSVYDLPSRTRGFA